MKKHRLRLNKPVKMLTLVGNLDPSLRPAGSDLVPLGTRVHLSSSRAGHIARVCSQQAATLVRWMWGTSRRVADLGRVTVKGLGYGAASAFQGARATAEIIRDGTTKVIGLALPGNRSSEERRMIAAAPSLETVSHDTDLIHEVRMLRAQVQAQNKILAELTYVLLEDRKRVRESDRLIGHHDRQTESRLLHVLQANAGAEENWGNTKSTSAQVIAD
ncbi:MAG: hypothetical protein OEV99_05115 [Nitrospira sp.]|nr:hypothetical protein [Nitrospira sp.]MDH4369206.1 hypothetical protein [Nitrospira sp.]MDH5348788.1 hypothetical protein [Nitrospira sp.]MDH5496656.1 hypothetical protein [Nitrospira sp.]MDH5724607.1 hypothetical protein [Nitrospira sp.]